MSICEKDDLYPYLPIKLTIQVIEKVVMEKKQVTRKLFNTQYNLPKMFAILH